MPDIVFFPINDLCLLFGATNEVLLVLDLLPLSIIATDLLLGEFETVLIGAKLTIDLLFCVEVIEPLLAESKLFSPITDCLCVDEDVTLLLLRSNNGNSA